MPDGGKEKAAYMCKNRLVISVLFVLFVFFLVGCGGSGSGGGNKPPDNTKPQTYTVTFNSNGGSAVGPVQRQGGGTVSAFASPTRICYAFVGWYFDNTTFANKVSIPYVVNENITLHAKWTELPELAGVTCITTATELNSIRNNLAGNYKLMADISLKTYGNWEPIGTAITPFSGTIDGSDYKIIGLTIKKETEEYVGLFGYVSGGTIANLAIEVVDILGKQYTGAVAGYVTNNSTITNCYSIGDIRSVSSLSSPSSPSYSGGIAGYVNKSTITGCQSTGNISSSHYYSYPSYSGGIAGYAYNSTIIDCYSTGDVYAGSGNSSYPGGIAGYVYNSTITDCYSTGDVSAGSGNPSYSGGIAGYVRDRSTITNCYSTGDVSAFSSGTSFSYAPSQSYSGGIAGHIETYSTITDCYSTGNISSNSISYTSNLLSNSYSGGIIGLITSSSTITNCYSTGDVFAVASVPSFSGTYSNSFSGGIAGRMAYGAINNCAANNNYITANTTAGRIVGDIFGTVSASNNIALDTMKAAEDGAQFDTTDTMLHGIDRSNNDLTQKTTYSDTIVGDGTGGLGWKFGNDADNPWKMPEGDNYTYPIFYWQ